jgi:hypothetical protein
MTKEIGQHKQTYICPAMEVVDIEMEQALLSASNGGQTEDLGETKKEMEWSNSRRGGDWGNLWE